MDGSVITDMFESEHLASNPVQTADSDEEDSRSKGLELSEDDQRLVEERLRGLGYIE
jgi:hypothetical protein